MCAFAFVAEMVGSFHVLLFLVICFAIIFHVLSAHQIENACRGVAPDTTAAMIQKLKDSGVVVLQSHDLHKGV